MEQASGGAKRWLITWCIPAIAMAVFARQVYLNKHHQLSTWKGGGMGMFAAADGSINRFAKVYLISPKRGRQPLVRLTMPQKRLMDSALWYPVRGSFEIVANAIFATSWAAGDQLTPASLVDSTGAQTGKAAQSYYMLYPFGTRSPDEKPDWELEIEYWAMAYDPATRRITAKQIAAHRFGAAS